MANGQPLVSFSTWVVAANYGSPGAAKVERGVGTMKRGELTPVTPVMAGVRTGPLIVLSMTA